MRPGKREMSEVTNCQYFENQLDNYLDGALSGREQATLAGHAQSCPACNDLLEQARTIRLILADEAPITPPSRGFESRMLAAATGPRTARRAPLVASAAAGGAVAAMLALAMVFWQGSSEPDGPVSGETANVWAPELREVRLAFASEYALEDVTLTLELPAHVELEPFPGRQQISWSVDLSPGENVLTLPLRVLFPAEGELVARLDDGGRQKTFRAPIPASGRADESSEE